MRSSDGSSQTYLRLLRPSDLPVIKVSAGSGNKYIARWRRDRALESHVQHA